MKLVNAALAAALSMFATSTSVAQPSSTLTVQSSDLKDLASYPVAALRSHFPQTTLTTTTPWSSRKEYTYRGILLKDVLTATGLETHPSILLVATDDFTSIIPTGDIAKFGPILAYERECTPDDPPTKCIDSYMPLDVAEHGPLFLVWPMNSLDSAGYSSRYNLWVWFITTIRAR